MRRDVAEQLEVPFAKRLATDRLQAKLKSTRTLLLEKREWTCRTRGELQRKQRSGGAEMAYLEALQESPAD
jgi:hypothetical protein